MHLPVFNENIRKIVQSLPMNEYFDILPSISKCKMIMFVEAALGTDWEPDVKQRYLRQFVAYVSKHLNGHSQRASHFRIAFTRTICGQLFSGAIIFILVFMQSTATIVTAIIIATH